MTIALAACQASAPARPSGASEPVQPPTLVNTAPVEVSPSMQATESPSPEPSAEPTEQPTDPPLIVTPFPGTGHATNPAGPAFKATRPNEKMGKATLTVRQWVGPDVDGPSLQVTTLSMPCAWTSASTVRPAFFQRVRLLGQNDILLWGVGVASDTVPGAAIDVYPDGPATAGEFAQPISIGDAVSAQYTPGAVSGTVTFRAAVLPAQLTTIGDASVNGMISWDCGAPPTASPVATPSPIAIEPGYPPRTAITITGASGSTAGMQGACGSGFIPPDGTMGPVASCAAMYGAIPVDQRITANTGRVLTVRTGDGVLLSTASRASFVKVADAGEANGLISGIPDGAPSVAPSASTQESLTFTAPAKGDYYVFVSLVVVQGEGWRQEGGFVARVLVS